MKLVVVGATGYVGAEVIRQSLRLPAIKTVVAIARRPVIAPNTMLSSSDVSKLKSVVVPDYGQFSDEAREQLRGATACIWTVAITPAKMSSVPAEELKRVCLDLTVAGVEALVSVRGDSEPPLRFIYMSAIAVTRTDDEKAMIPKFIFPTYGKLRGDVERYLASYQASNSAKLTLCVVRPGLIMKAGQIQWTSWIRWRLLQLAIGMPRVDLDETAMCMLHQAINGIEKDPILNDDMVVIGRGMLESV